MRKLFKFIEGKNHPTEFMSVQAIEYIPCPKCAYNLIRKSEKSEYIAKIGNILIFEVTTRWIRLKCSTIQRKRFNIRKIREN